MSSVKIAEQIIKSMENQMDLIFTLSVAICGGLIALFIQLAIHNHTQSSNIEMKGAILFLVTFVFEGLSLIFGYFSRGSITSNIPKINSLDFSKIERWGAVSFDGYGTLKFLFIMQFILFIVGIACLFILLLMNKDLIERRVP